MTDRRTWDSTLAVLAVAATYAWFLLFAQYGFLHLAGQTLGDAGLTPLMKGMGLAGLALSLAVAGWLRGRHPLPLVRLGLALCALTGPAALAATGPGGFLAAAVLVGGSLAVLTVSLATLLPRLGSHHHPAWLIGLGTGLAYFIGNLPPLFSGSPGVQVAAVTALVLAALAATWLPLDLASQPPPGDPAQGRGWGAAAIVVSLLALVWFDSAAFYVIQETWTLKGLTWGTPARQLLQGTAHLGAAIAAGWLVARGRLRELLPFALGLFAIAYWLLIGHPALAPLAGPLYAAGVSLYSVALAAWPGSSPEAPGALPIRWRAGLAYAVAGWVGSAMGIGMAQDLHRVPGAFLTAAGLAVAGAWLMGSRCRSAVRIAGGALAGMVFLSCLGASQPTPRASADPVARGRAVYLAEGCIHCHSQYVRPGTTDEIMWGPFRPLDRAARPVLIGNRRQGPDLLNVGNRRSADWQRLHLQQPQSLDAASRMPAYDHLFADGSTRGDDLVAYLTSLGQETLLERVVTTQSWALPPSTVPLPAPSAELLFVRNCTPCHGPEGRGDGPLSARLVRPARDLQAPELGFVPASLPPEQRRAALARIVKFGLPGTSMPGHETYTDAQVAGLVEWILARRQATEGTP